MRKLKHHEKKLLKKVKCVAWHSVAVEYAGAEP